MKPEKKKPKGISDRAAEWVWKCDRGLSAAEQDELHDWLSESKEHRQAYAEHSFAWDELARLAGLQNTDYAPVVPDLLGADANPWHRKYRIFSIIAFGLPVAASLLFAIGYFFFNDPHKADLSLQEYQLEVVNHIRQQNLGDGSVVDLNKGAAIEENLTQSERRVKLLAGEANFNVHKDPSRPFIVEAAGVQLRAVGTIFNVRIMDNKVDVVVTEGVVAIQAPGLGNHPAQAGREGPLIRENYRAVINFQSGNPELTINPARNEELNSELLWQPRLIDFENAPLSEIAEEFNRRNPLNIRIEDEEIKSLRFTSIFWSNNVKSFIRLLEANYGISAEVVNDSEIILKRSKEPI